MAAKEMLFGNDTYITAESVTNESTGQFINSSTEIKLRLLDSLLNEVVAEKTMTYIAASSGNYEYVWDKALHASLAAGSYYLEYSKADGLDFKRLQSVVLKQPYLT